MKAVGFKAIFPWVGEALATWLSLEAPSPPTLGGSNPPLALGWVFYQKCIFPSTGFSPFETAKSLELPWRPLCSWGIPVSQEPRAQVSPFSLGFKPVKGMSSKESWVPSAWTLLSNDNNQTQDPRPQESSH